MSPIRTKSKKSLTISTDLDMWYGSNMSPINRCGSPEAMYCTGECRENPSEEGLSADNSADVVSVLQASVSLQASSWSFVSKSRFPCLRQRMDSDHGKIRKDRL